MLTKEILDEFVEDKTSFRKELKNKTLNDFFDFLNEIIEFNNQMKGCHYKLRIDNRWDIPFEEICLVEKTGQIRAYYYLDGGRIYKNINAFAAKAELLRFNNYGNFGVYKE